MKVLVVTSHALGIEGGSSYLARRVETGLRRIGAEVDLLSLPFTDHDDNPLRQMLGFRALEIGSAYDRVITLRWPSHLVRHAHKVTWFHHHKRDLFDLYGTAYSSRRDTAENRTLRGLIRSADTAGLSESKRVFALSSEVAKRLKVINGVDATVLRAAPTLSELRGLRSGEPSRPRTIVYLNRITSIKRQRLMIEAMVHLPASYRLHIAGFPESPTYLDELQIAVGQLKLGERVQIEATPLDPYTKRLLLSRADCLANFPFMEDSHGFPTLEGAAAGAALVTTSDAGGICEFVQDGRTGWISDPSPESIAKAIQQACDRGPANSAVRDAARALGEQYSTDFDTRLLELMDEA